MLRNHGAPISEEMRHAGQKPYVLADFALLGFNYRMSDLQGAVGLVQLGKLDRYIDERQHWSDYYARELKDIPWLRLPRTPAGYRHGWQSYVCLVDPDKAPMARNDIMEVLLRRGIHTRPGTHAVHVLGYYRERFGFRSDDFPMARECDAWSMAIPLHNRMTSDDYARVVEALRAVDQ
jgi:dTDP-4-amino-4,6-dideoxygalactose transaminase